MRQRDPPEPAALSPTGLLYAPNRDWGVPSGKEKRDRLRKGHWLLALLLLRHGGEVDRSWPAGTLWPDSRASQGLSSLRSMLAAVREALGPDAPRLGSPTAQTLTLDLTGVEVDLLDFDARGSCAPEQVCDGLQECLMGRACCVC